MEGDLKHERGLSLVEVIFTFALLGMILMVLFNLFPASVLAIRHAEHRIKAVGIAQSIIEERRGSAFSDLPTAPVTTEDIDDDDQTLFRSTIECYDISGTESSNIKRICVTVVWSEKNALYSISKEQDLCVIQH